MDKRIISLVWALGVLTGVVAARFPLTSASSLIEVSVSPQYVSVDVGQSFSVNITIANVPSPGVFAYQFSLYYDSAVLQCVSVQIPSDHFLKPSNPRNLFIVDPGTINQTQGRATLALTLLGTEAGKTGRGALATVQFTGLAAGTTLLEIAQSDFILADANMSEIPSSQYQLTPGNVSVSSKMVVFLSPDSDSVDVGQSFSVNVSIANVPSPGIYSYRFNLCYDNAVLQGAGALIPSDSFLRPSNPNDVFIVDPGTVNQSGGCVTFGVTLLGTEPGKTGSGVLATVQFTGLAAGTSLLEIGDIYLVDPNASLFASDQYDLGRGSVVVAPTSVLHPVSIADYVVSFGANVTVEAVVENASTITGGSSDICFDEGTALSVSAGDFGVPVYVIDNDAGLVKIAVAGTTAVGKDVATLARVTFHVQGYARLRLQNALLSDEQGNTFPPLTKDGSIYVEKPEIVISSCSVEVGLATNVSIDVVNGENIAGFSVNMGFDSSLINVVDVFPGDFGVPIVNIRNNESMLSLSSALAGAVGKTNATLALVSFIGISEGKAYFNVQTGELYDEQGDVATLFPRLPHSPGGYGLVVVTPEFQPIELLLVCLLLGSTTIVTKKKLLTKRSALPRIKKQ